MRRKLLLLLIAILPWTIKRYLLVKILGHSIHPTARIGVSFMDVGHIVMGEGARIGSLNCFRGPGQVFLGKNALIGNLNWFTTLPGDHMRASPGRKPEISLGDESAITNRHYFDVQDSIEIGAFTTIAGIRSTFLTHQIDIGMSCQTAAGIRIGSFCFISTNCVLLAGAAVADKVVVAAGAVVKGGLPASCALYGGVPARMLREIDAKSAYFLRQRGSVS